MLWGNYLYDIWLAGGCLHRCVWQLERRTSYTWNDWILVLFSPGIFVLLWKSFEETRYSYGKLNKRKHTLKGYKTLLPICWTCSQWKHSLQQICHEKRQQKTKSKLWLNLFRLNMENGLYSTNPWNCLRIIWLLIINQTKFILFN